MVLRAISASSRLGAEKLERLARTLARIAIATGEPEEDPTEEGDQS
jgi:uncharacterized protein (DUF2236 family)